MVRDIARSALLLLLVLRFGVASLAAQRTSADTAAPAAQGYAPSTERETVPSAPTLTSAAPSARAIVLPTRSEGEVDQGLRLAQAALSRADSQLTLAAARQAKANELVQERGSQLGEIEAKKRQADREKRSADKPALEAQKRVVERQKALAEELRTLNDAEVGAAKVAREAAIARQQALELERQLVSKGDRSTVVSHELERQTLAAQKKAAGLERALAGKLEFVASKRLDLYREYLDGNKLGY